MKSFKAIEQVQSAMRADTIYEQRGITLKHAQFCDITRDFLLINPLELEIEKIVSDKISPIIISQSLRKMS